MKWLGRRQSDNVEDRRGLSGGGKTLVGGGILGIIILIVNLIGGDTAKLLNPVLDQIKTPTENAQESPQALSDEDKQLGEFASTVFADTEDTWSKLYQENGETYDFPKMVLFKGEVETACGGASSASGPFYCPSDRKVYMDLGFFEELKNKLGAKGGDFAIAYVIAHEVGHHIQTLNGNSARMRRNQVGKTEAEANKLSVALELQADFYAGIWSHYNQKYMESGDIEEALSAAEAVGDDAIQKRMQGHVVPESFTHGTSEQRKYWFMKGFQSGDLSQGNTFKNLLEE